MTSRLRRKRSNHRATAAVITTLENLLKMLLKSICCKMSFSIFVEVAIEINLLQDEFSFLRWSCYWNQFVARWIFLSLLKLLLKSICCKMSFPIFVEVAIEINLLQDEFSFPCWSCYWNQFVARWVFLSSLKLLLKLICCKMSFPILLFTFQQGVGIAETVTGLGLQRLVPQLFGYLQSFPAKQHSELLHWHS